MKNVTKDAIGDKRMRNFFLNLQKQNKEDQGEEGDLILQKRFTFSVGNYSIVMTKLSRSLLDDKEVDWHRNVFCKCASFCMDYSFKKRIEAFSCVNCPQKNNPRFEE